MAEKRNDYVIMETNLGSVEVELYWDESKSICSRFYNLCQNGYYNGCIFHRIIPDFMIQTGDPTNTGRSLFSSSDDDHDEDEVVDSLKEIEDTFSSSSNLLKFTGAGIVAWIIGSNSNSNSNHQFFITLAPTPWLDSTLGKENIIFGRIKSGLGVVKRISLVKTDLNSNRLIVCRPLEDDVVILRMVAKKQE